MNRDVITDELFDFIKTYTIRNAFVSSLLQTKRISILKEISENKIKEEYLELIKKIQKTLNLLCTLLTYLK